MLAELLHLTLNLHDQGITPNLVHRDFRNPGLSSFTTLKAVLNQEGRIVRLAPISPDDKPGLWTLAGGNFNFFPAVRLPNSPLNLAADDARWSTLTKAPGIEAIRTFVSEQRPATRPIELSDLWNKQGRRILKWSLSSQHPTLGALHGFANAFGRFAATADGISLELVRAAEKALKLTGDPDFGRTLLMLLIGQRKESKGKVSTEYKVQVCFDYAPPDEPGFTLYSPRVAQVVLEMLHSEASHDQTPHKASLNDGIRCAVSGATLMLSEVLNDPFPEWSVRPTLSKPVRPFSKFSDARCNARYRRADSQAIPIGVETANRLVAGLQTLTDRFSGSAWRPIRNGRLDERNRKKVEAQDVLIAYPSCTIDELAAVSLFAPRNAATTPQDEQFNAKSFKDAAEPVCRALSAAVGRESFRPYLTILLIRQMSPGQVQLAYANTPSLEHFVNAVQEWIASGNNLPPALRVPLPSKKAANGLSWSRPALLFPEQISRLLSHQWIRAGNESARVEAPPIGTVLDLFLRKTGVWQGVAEQLLDVILARAHTLLVHAGHVLHKDDRHSLSRWREFATAAKSGRDPRHPDYALAQTLSLIGSLLFTMDSHVKTYMNESPYLVGKLLAMMDELHKRYCEVVRDGDIPSSLIGNGLLGRVADSPAHALAELSERSRIYIGWARSATIDQKTSDERRIAIHSARKLLRLAQPLCELLHGDDSLNGELTSVQKAHLFLGYLSPVLGGEAQSPNDSVSENVSSAPDNPDQKASA